MDRKRAMVLAASAAIVAGSGAIAVGANFGLLGFSRVEASAPPLPISADNGRTNAAGGPPDTEVQYVDVPVTVPALPPTAGQLPAEAGSSAPDGEHPETTPSTIAPSPDGSSPTTTSTTVGHREDDSEHTTASSTSTTEPHGFEDD
jgi:hypothetical protein